MESSYKKLALIVPLNTLLMFLMTYSLIDTWDHFYPNINRAYMAIIMVAPMTLVMMWMMKDMFKNQKLNLVLYGLFFMLFIGTFWVARSQTGIGNEMFLRSMIPHHSSAILMCERATITNPEITKLCKGIIRDQKKEISQMKEILMRY